MGRLIEKIADVLQPDPNMSILILKDKINEMIEKLEELEKRVGRAK